MCVRGRLQVYLCSWLAPIKRRLSKMEQYFREVRSFFDSHVMKMQAIELGGLKWHGLLWWSMILQSRVQPPLDGGKLGVLGATTCS